MSVSFSVSRKKREFLEDNNELTTFGALKKTRHVPPPNGFHLQGCGANKEGLIITLRDAFPMLDEKVIATVLEEYGDNVEAAIAKLEQLHLNPQLRNVNNALESVSNNVTSSSSPPSPIHTRGDGGFNGVMSRTVLRVSIDQVGSGEMTIASNWVETLLQELSHSENLGDSKLRVEAILKAFEEAAVQNYKDNSNEMKEAKREFATLRKNNVILCKALTQKQDRYKAQDEELSRLREILAQAEERIKSLEVSNYSLTMHLERAIGPRANNPGAPPDIF